MSDHTPHEHEEKKRLRLPDHAAMKAALIWIIASVGTLAVFAMFTFAAAAGYERLYDHRIFPGVRVWGVRIDGLTENEARITLNEQIDTALKDGLRFTYDGHEILVDETAGNDPDASHDLLSYDVEDAVRKAIAFGRDGNFLQNSLSRWRARVSPEMIPGNVVIDNAGIQNAATHAIGDLSKPPMDAHFVILWNPDGSPNIRVADGVDGTVLSFDKALNILRQQSATLTFLPIQIDHTTSQPTITKAEVEPLVSEAASWLSRAPLTFHVQTSSTVATTTVQISKDMLAAWIKVSRENGSVRLALDADAFHRDIRSLTHLETAEKKGSLTIQDGKIISFETGTAGTTIDDAQTLDGIRQNIATTSTFALIVHGDAPVLDGSDPARLGIKEIIGIGTSDFSGSPNNRQKNIAIGVSRVNGTLIAPGAEFSLLKTLGPITADYGWLPELVIKGNKTTPELGGGLCQIGTTAFRAALNSGMKITERQNHSYRVRYYEPAGTDATIYDPAPDFRFVNDTANWIMIRAYIKGTTITYEFWGTKDGRTATAPTPTISKIVQPPPKKIVETLDLPPGKTKCTETAHPGADADLTYTVTYADGTSHQEIFHSHYKPWQAVCLVGVEKLSTDTGAATSTAEVPMTP